MLCVLCKHAGNVSCATCQTLVYLNKSLSSFSKRLTGWKNIVSGKQSMKSWSLEKNKLTWIMVHDNTVVFKWSHSKQVKEEADPESICQLLYSTAVNLKGTHGAWRRASFCSFYLFFIFPFFFFNKVYRRIQTGFGLWTLSIPLLQRHMMWTPHCESVLFTWSTVLQVHVTCCGPWMNHM